MLKPLHAAHPCLELRVAQWHVWLLTAAVLVRHKRVDVKLSLARLVACPRAREHRKTQLGAASNTVNQARRGVMGGAARRNGRRGEAYWAARRGVLGGAARRIGRRGEA